MQKVCWIPLLLASFTAHAVSFDCAKARTPQEKAICASPKLSAADDRLDAAYKATLAAAPPDAIAEIRAGQREWLSRMAAECATGENPSDGLTECLLAEYTSRIAALNHTVLRQGSITFVWRTITLTAKDSPDSPGGSSAAIAKPGYGTMTATWPETNAGTPQWKAWNAAILTATQTMAARADVGQGTRWDSAWAQDIDEQVTTSIGIVSDSLVTASVSNTWYGHGAAHGNVDFMEFNWLLKQQRELRASDVFRTGSGWEKVLAARSLESLNKQSGEDIGSQWAPGYLDKTLREIVTSPARWIVDADGLTLTFEQGSVTCRACEAGPITIPWADLKPLLNPAFVPPTESVDKSSPPE